MSRRFMGAWKCVCCTTAFFLLPSCGRLKFMNYNSLMVAVIGILQIRFAGAKGARREMNTSSTNIPPIDVKGICHAVPQ